MDIAEFVAHDGSLTPIVARSRDAIISDGMQKAVRALARSCDVCEPSGRDRARVFSGSGALAEPNESLIAVHDWRGRDDVLPPDVDDDITDEDALRALVGRGPGILVADRAGPEPAGRRTAAECFLRDIEEVENLLDSIAHRAS